MWKKDAEKSREAERLYQEALSHDEDTIKVLDSYYGTDKHSALDTPEKRAAWLVGFITGQCGGQFHIGPSGEWLEKWKGELGYYRCLGSVVPKHHCNKCGYEWPALKEHPKKCPDCQSRKWDE